MGDVALAPGPAAPALTSTGLRLPDNLDEQGWRELGGKLGRMHRASPWLVGDWARWGYETLGRSYVDAAVASGLAHKTIKNYAYIAGKFPPGRRRAELTLKHHEVVAAQPDDVADSWLARAAADLWSWGELVDELSRAGLYSAPSTSVVARSRRGLGSRARPHVSRSPSPRTLLRVNVTGDQLAAYELAAAARDATLAEWAIAALDTAASELPERELRQQPPAT